jgi:hypothetical protein
MLFGPPHASPDDVALVRGLHRRLVQRVGEPEAADLTLELLTPGERALYVLVAAADQVGRGGFEQLFYFLPELAQEAAASAELVKARRFQRLFEQATAIAFDEPKRKRSGSEFRRMMSAVEGGDLGRLDDEFDALMTYPSTRLETFLVRYVHSSAHEFGDA